MRQDIAMANGMKRTLQRVKKRVQNDEIAETVTIMKPVILQLLDMTKLLTMRRRLLVRQSVGMLM